MSTNISKHISFPAPLLEMLMAKAKSYGVSIPEYIRHLAINDVHKSEYQKRKEWENSLPVYHATSEESKSIEEGVQEIAEGKSKIVTVEELLNEIA